MPCPPTPAEPRALRSHPHVHSRVTGGGRPPADPWRPSRPDVVVPVKPLAVLCRATCRDARKKTALFSLVTEPGWHKAWGVPGAPVDRGQEACSYLAPSLFRVAIRHPRLRTLAEAEVPLQSKASAMEQGNTAPVPAEECMRRLLQHVLPERCITVRSDGVRSPANRHRLTQASPLLSGSGVATTTRGTGGTVQDPPAASRASCALVLQSVRGRGDGGCTGGQRLKPSAAPTPQDR